MKARSVLGLLVLAVSGAALAQDAADLVLRNGKIVTVDPDNAEAQALAARDGVIIAVGSNEDVSSYIGGSTNVIDLGTLNGALAIPGVHRRPRALHGHRRGDAAQARHREELERDRPGREKRSRGV